MNKYPLKLALELNATLLRVIPPTMLDTLTVVFVPVVDVTMPAPATGK